jgi:glycosyltransferase involved in cell wall biosynthesis
VADPLVTVVLPCFNEEGHVVAEVDRICAAMDGSGYSYELLAIDDKSTDSTLDKLREAAQRHPAVRVIAFPRNGGSGTARRIGTQEARSEIVVWTDADMTYPNERIPEFVELLLREPQVAQVVGRRNVEAGRLRFLRVPAKWFVRRLAEYLANTDIPDLNSGMRAFRRRIAEPFLHLLPPGFSCVTTLTLAFLSNQQQIDYISIDYRTRSGSSKFHPIQDAYRYVMQVLRMIMYFNPLRVLMPIALVLLAVATLKGIWDQFNQPFYLPANTVVMFLSALIIGSLALLADLVVRSRPR